MNGTLDRLADTDLQTAHAVLKAKGRTFYWASHGLKALHAQRATRLYAFCRLVDDLADTAISPEAAKAELAGISEAIACRITDDARVRDMLKLMQDCEIDPAIVQELLAGVMSDLDEVRIADVDALLHYCYQVAGTVGLMMCKVLDVRDAASGVHAVDLGVAMQLTNICRDVAEDARAGRRYLPASAIGDLPPGALVCPDAELRPRLRQCVADLLDLADAYYQNGENGLPYLPFTARCGILVAARLYRAIGTGLRRRNYDYWSDRVFVRTRRKCVLTASALFTQLGRPGFWVVPRQAHQMPSPTSARMTRISGVDRAN